MASVVMSGWPELPGWPLQSDGLAGVGAGVGGGTEPVDHGRAKGNWNCAPVLSSDPSNAPTVHMANSSFERFIRILPPGAAWWSDPDSLSWRGSLVPRWHPILIYGSLRLGLRTGEIAAFRHGLRCGAMIIPALSNQGPA